MRNCIKALSCLLASVAFFAGEVAYADVSCSYSLSGVNIGPDGTVAATFTGYGYSRYWVLCSVSNNWGGVNTGSNTIAVTAEACKAMYSQLLTARASGRNIGLTFATLPNCADASAPAAGLPTPYPYIFGF